MDLFYQKPVYTIDICSLIEMFNETRPYCKKHFPGLWNKVYGMICAGIIISHIEVYKEIQESDDELSAWATEHKFMFKDYDLVKEPALITMIGSKFETIVNGKVKAIHADPWLIAQASAQNLSIITQEVYSQSPKSQKAHIPNVCNDPELNLGVNCYSLYALIKVEGWVFS